MGVVGSFLGKGLVMLTAGTVGFILGGPVGAGIAMSEAAVTSHVMSLVGLLAPL